MDTNDYSNCGKKWTEEQEEELKKLYNQEELDLITIAKQLKRLPGGVISRLIKLEIIEYDFQARGYNKEEIFKLKQNYENNKTKIKEDNNDVKEDNDKKDNIKKNNIELLILEIKKLHINNKELYDEIKELRNDNKELRIEMQKLKNNLKFYTPIIATNNKKG
jgi:hypothetical protein